MYPWYIMNLMHVGRPPLRSYLTAGMGLYTIDTVMKIKKISGGVLNDWIVSFTILIHKISYVTVMKRKQNLWRCFNDWIVSFTILMHKLSYDTVMKRKKNLWRCFEWLNCQFYNFNARVKLSWFPMWSDSQTIRQIHFIFMFRLVL